jgi:hypothetical protein
MKIRMKINLKAFVVSLIFLGYILQIAFQRYIGPLGYYDEMLTVVSYLYVMSMIARNEMTSETRRAFIIIGLLIIIGLCGNIFGELYFNKKAILTDLGNSFKIFFVLFVSYEYFLKFRKSSNLIDYLDFYCKCFVVVPGTFLAIVNLFVDIHMYSEYIYGIRAFNYIFAHVGTLNSVCVSCILIQTLKMLKLTAGERRVQLIYIFMNLLLMVSTLRSRAFVFAFVYIIGYYAIILRKRETKIRMRYVIVMAIVSLVIAMPKIRFYFDKGNEAARGLLLRHGIKAANEFFPLGAGFGNYGTYAAAKYWSPLYIRYNFDQYYGMNRQDSRFIVDTYWPAIMGEFGWLGFALMVMLLAMVYLTIIRETKNNKYCRLVALYGMVCVTISSMVSSSFFNFTNMITASVIGLAIGVSRFINNERKVQRNEDTNSTHNAKPTQIRNV